jgi:hypothetical protein
MLGARKMMGDGSELDYGLYRAGSDFLRRDLCLEIAQETDSLPKVYGASKSICGYMWRVWASAKE